MEREEEDPAEVKKMQNELNMELYNNIKHIIISLHLGVSDGIDCKVEDASNVKGTEEENQEILKKLQGQEKKSKLLDSFNPGTSVDIVDIPINIDGSEEEEEGEEGLRDFISLIDYHDEELERSIEWRNGA